MYQVKNWSSYQSYKDRRPPWIRFHKTTLDDFDFQKMSANARALLPMLWLLASEHEDPTSGIINLTFQEISFRLRLSEQDVAMGFDEIIKSGFINELTSCNETVTKSLPVRNQSVTPETETETETEKRKKGVSRPDDVSEGIWSDFVAHRKTKKAAITETAIKGYRREAEKAGISLEQAIEVSILRGWVGFNADWLKDKNASKPTTTTRRQYNPAEYED